MNLEEPHNTLFQTLNPEQEKAVRHYKGPILILAGAGSGKTRVLTHRVVNLILEHGEDPRTILAVTFTNKATGEMRERISTLLKEAEAKVSDEKIRETVHNSSVWVATFHSAALRMLRQHAHALDFEPNFVVYDEDDSGKMVELILNELGYDKKKYPPKLFLRAFDRFKNNLITPKQAQEEAAGFKSYNLQDKIIAEVYELFQNKMRKCNAMDFGDLLMYGVLLLENNREVLDYYQRRLKFILVDEFQDTNIAQYRWVQLLTEKHKNLLVVGDDDQSIYSFRGATIKNILDFERDFPDAVVVKLEQNYRSTKNVLELANQVIKENKNRKIKKLWSDGIVGDKISVACLDSEVSEANFIAQKIVSFSRTGGRLSDIAIFYRTNAQSRAIEESLMRFGIQYKIYGGLKFYDRKEIKDILAYLRLIANLKDDQAFIRAVGAPSRGVGNKTIEQLQTIAREKNGNLFSSSLDQSISVKGLKSFVEFIKNLKESLVKKDVSEIIEEIVTKTGYQKKLEEEEDAFALSRLENLKELQALARSVHDKALTNEENLRLFLDRASLSSSADLPEEEIKVGEHEEKIKNISTQGTVSLMTLHLAKGLEFKLVFLTGVEEGLLPHSRSIEDGGGAIEEERRLFYVGVTRARQKLYITRTSYRGMFAKGGASSYSGGYRTLSRFGKNLPQDICTEEGEEEFFSRSYSDFEFGDRDNFEEMETNSFKDKSWKEQKKQKQIKKLLERENSRESLLTSMIKSADNVYDYQKIKDHEPIDILPPEELTPGVKVVHSLFGKGVVKEVEGEITDPKSLKVQVLFNNDKRKDQDSGMEPDRETGKIRRLSYLYARLGKG